MVDGQSPGSVGRVVVAGPLREDSTFCQPRADVVHHPLDPIIVAGPWVVAAGLVVKAVRRRRLRTVSGASAFLIGGGAE
jgi:hypothetical protein